jgi:hypothetical protein
MRKLRPLSWVIIAVNLLFVWWIIGGVGGAVAESCTGMTGDELSACEAGTAIGAGIGTMFILFFWVVIDIILLVIFLVTNKKGREFFTQNDLHTENKGLNSKIYIRIRIYFNLNNHLKLNYYKIKIWFFIYHCTDTFCY